MIPAISTPAQRSELHPRCSHQFTVEEASDEQISGRCDCIQMKPLNGSPEKKAPETLQSEPASGALYTNLINDTTIKDVKSSSEENNKFVRVQDQTSSEPSINPSSSFSSTDSSLDSENLELSLNEISIAGIDRCHSVNSALNEVTNNQSVEFNNSRNALISARDYSQSLNTINSNENCSEMIRSDTVDTFLSDSDSVAGKYSSCGRENCQANYSQRTDHRAENNGMPRCKSIGSCLTEANVCEHTKSYQLPPEIVQSLDNINQDTSFESNSQLNRSETVSTFLSEQTNSQDSIDAVPSNRDIPGGSEHKKPRGSKDPPADSFNDKGNGRSYQSSRHGLISSVSNSRRDASLYNHRPRTRRAYTHQMRLMLLMSLTQQNGRSSSLNSRASSSDRQSTSQNESCRHNYDGLRPSVGVGTELSEYKLLLEETYCLRRGSIQSSASSSSISDQSSSSPDGKQSNSSVGRRYRSRYNTDPLIRKSVSIIVKKKMRSRSCPPLKLIVEECNGNREKEDTSKWHGDQYRGDGPRRSVSGEDIPNSFNDGGSKPGTPLPGTPTTPHIVVSGDQCEANQDFGQAEINLKSEDGRVTPIDAQSIEGSGRLLGLDAGEQRARHNSISSYLSPEIGINLSRKTRRNSMIDMMQRASSVNNLCLTPTQQQHLARVAAAATIKHGTSRTSLSPSNIDWRHEGNDSMIACLSALYGKILVVMGLAFPIGDFISGRMSAVVFKAFKLYLHIGSIIFLVFAYMFLLRAVSISKVDVKARLQSLNRNKSSELERGGEGGNEDARSMSVIGPFQGNKNYTITESTHESMYLKMGAMVFGIGSMIYSGLEVGRYFDFRAVPECDDPLRFVSPVSRMIFTFIQMYFIFLNSRVAINKHRIIARFGLMHMIATNLCIWLNVLVEETKHEIHSFQHKLHHDAHLHDLGNGTAAVLGGDHHVMSTHNTTSGDSLHPGASLHHFVPDKDEHHIVRRATDSYSLYDYCQETGMMKNLVENASHFLYPCTIEYSLLCSGVLYVIWKNINKSDKGNNGRSGDSDISTFIARKARHHYSVDCAHATRGLFMGILVLVLTIISLILFFVLISNEKMKSVAVLEANIIELSLYSVAIITVVIGMVQMRELEFVEDGDIELDNILLLIAQTGTYIYTSFSIIGGNINESSERLLSFMTAVITLIQTTLQTLFILNASRRCCYTYDQLTRKPGREMVTFLLICNLAMWAISTFETSRADAHPTLVNYYGVWAWTIISHVSMPLAIFYRFHVTVCLCEIWKRSYKLKHDFI